MDFAAIDIGNTRVKITFFLDDRRDTLIMDSLEGSIEYVRERGIRDVAYCSTRKLEEEEREEMIKSGWFELKPTERIPLKIDYATPETLGPDRLAAAIGAHSLFPLKNVMIADLGTALTIDIVNSSGHYLGGNISPGANIRFRALHDYTAKLPLVKKSDGEGYFGKDTESAIGYGVRWGMANEIAGAFAIGIREEGCQQLIVTGGDSLWLYTDIKQVSPQGFSISCEPDLVALGLKEAYYYNKDDY